MSKSKSSTIALLIVAVIWGGAYLGVESAINAGWETFPLLLIRGFLGGSVVLLFTLKKNWKNRALFKDGIIAGTFYFFGFAFQTFGQKLSLISNIAFLTALNIVFVPIIEIIIYKRKVRLQLVIASLLAFVGVSFLTFEQSISLRWADILGILCAICFAFQIVYIKKSASKHDHDPLQLTVVQLYTMGFLSLLGMFVANETNFTFKGIEGVLYAALLSSALASVIQIWAQKNISSSKAGVIIGLEALFATIFAVMFNYETLTNNIIIGGIIMLSAIILTEIDFKKQNEITKYKI